MDAGDGNGMCFPYDVLLDILRRLPGATIAACQCVCRSWRAIVDAHELSLERYFPRRAFSGIFFNKQACWASCCFFTPPGSRRLYYPSVDSVLQSCNGLLLILTDSGEYQVLNPATARHARLPSLTTVHADFKSLVFDPAVSLHYDVFAFHKDFLDKAAEAPQPRKVQEEVSEEPKEKVFPVSVYSSCTGQWESRVFAPGRCAPGHLYDLLARPPISGYEGTFWSSEYWRGSLYVHCHNNVLMTLCPSKGTYDIVMFPEKRNRPKCLDWLPWNPVVANYERGIHYVVIDDLHLRVWLLTESTDGQLGWTVAHDASLKPHTHMIHPLKIHPSITWVAVGSSSGPASLTKDYVVDEEEEVYEDGDGSEYSWNSDEDNLIDVNGEATHLGEPAASGDRARIAGFHPHKNALILLIYSAVVIYNLDASRMQYLGSERELTKDPEHPACGIDGSFIYRPCYDDVLPAGKLSL